MPTTQVKPILTGEILKAIAPSLSIARANKIADSMSRILPVYAMYNKEVLPEFLAQVTHESNEFSAKAESLNYSAQALANTWPTRFAVDAHAKAMVPNSKALEIQRQPRLIANAAYNGRMGNKLGTDDGWNFRGSGFMQLTGKDSVLPYYNFKKAGKGYKFDKTPATIEDLVSLLRTDDDWAIDSACWEFAISKGLIDEAQRNEFEKITRAINGGLIGQPSREQYYKRALQLF